MRDSCSTLPAVPVNLAAERANNLDHPGSGAIPRYNLNPAGVGVTLNRHGDHPRDTFHTPPRGGTLPHDTNDTFVQNFLMHFFSYRKFGETCHSCHGL